MARLSYAAWVNEHLQGKTKQEQEAIRDEYWSNYGRVVNYDYYAEVCKIRRQEADSEPEGYWEWKDNSLYRTTGYLLGGLGVLTYFLSGIIGATTGRRRN